MNRRVRIATAALFALSLILQTSSLSAATRDRDSFAPGFVQQVVKKIKNVLKPVVQPNENNTFFPGPPKP